jgi:hypothetical protein
MTQKAKTSHSVGLQPPGSLRPADRRAAHHASWGDTTLRLTLSELLALERSRLRFRLGRALLTRSLPCERAEVECAACTRQVRRATSGLQFTHTRAGRPSRMKFATGCTSCAVFLHTTSPVAPLEVLCLVQLALCARKLCVGKRRELSNTQPHSGVSEANQLHALPHSHRHAPAGRRRRSTGPKGRHGHTDFAQGASSLRVSEGQPGVQSGPDIACGLDHDPEAEHTVGRRRARRLAHALAAGRRARCGPTR